MNSLEMLFDLNPTLIEIGLLVLTNVFISLVFIPLSRRVLAYQAVGMIGVVIVACGVAYLLGLPKESWKEPLHGTERDTMTGALYGPLVHEEGSTSKFFGGYRFVVDDTVPIPRRGQDELLIQVAGASLNPVDYKVNRARVPVLRWLVSHVVGVDGAGTVVSKGSRGACNHFKVGDRVSGLAAGSLAKYAAMKCSTAGKIPNNLSMQDAATLPVAGYSAYFGLHNLLSFGKDYQGQVTKHQVKPGEKLRVMVIGASGGCGILGVQLAKVANAEVYGIASSRNAEFVKKDVGADHVITYDAQNFHEQLEKLAGTFDVVYDTVTSMEDMDYYPIAHKLLKPSALGGAGSTARYVALNGHISDWLRRIVSFLPSMVSPIFDIQRPDFNLHLDRPDPEMMEHLMQLVVANGKAMRPIKAKVYTSLTENNVNEAYSQLKSRRTKGKIVFDL